MQGSPTIECSKCNAEVPSDLDLCPQCGVEINATDAAQSNSAQERSPKSTEPEWSDSHEANSTTRRSGEDGRVPTDEPSTQAAGMDEGLNSGHADTGGRGIVSRFGFAAVVGIVGGIIILSPIFLIGPDAFSLLFAESGGGVSRNSSRNAGYAVATVITMAGGALCLLAASIRLGGVGFDVSRIAGALGVLAGIIGILMMFIV